MREKCELRERGMGSGKRNEEIARQRHEPNVEGGKERGRRHENRRGKGERR